SGGVGDGECPRVGDSENIPFSFFFFLFSFFFFPCSVFPLASWFFLQKTLNVYNQQVKYLRQDPYGSST
ncbi:hypothetical protein, partial [Tychonema sp. LEGE 07203]|uniref:hypothetical protein n=1 Tax=Tychonema sp. LEGE 07203 TaxID=1828671 RepID=UPI001D139748